MKTRTLVFAHRGWHLHQVENTLPAIQAAYAEGCDGVEFDVQLTADGIPVLFHDDDLARLAGRRESLTALNWRDLKEITIQQNGYRAQIPSLDDFLAQYGQKPFYLELKVAKEKEKDEAYTQALAQTCIERVLAARPHVLTFFASFHLPLIRSLSLTFTEINLGVIYEHEAVLESVLQEQEIVTTSRPLIHSLDARIWRQRLKQGKMLPPPKRLWLWGLENEPEMNQAIEMNLGGLVADDVPALLRAANSTTM